MATNNVAPHFIQPDGTNNNTNNACKRESSTIEDLLTTSSNWIKLNVGGTYFSTSKTTLKKYPDCILYELVRDPGEKLSPFLDETGAVLIDRDPKYFSVILEYLRSGDFYFCSSICESAIRAEAKYFNLPQLAELVTSKIKKKQLELQATNVHRVCSLKHDEISSFLSSLSDGWKLCQILPNQKENTFLVIVAKCFDTPLTPMNAPFAPKAAKVFDSPKEPAKSKSKTFGKFL